MYGYAEEQNIVIVSYIKKNVFVFSVSTVSCYISFVYFLRKYKSNPSFNPWLSAFTKFAYFEEITFGLILIDIFHF